MANRKTRKTIDELFACGKEITAAMRRAVRAATAPKTRTSKPRPAGRSARKPAPRTSRRAA